MNDHEEGDLNRLLLINRELTVQEQEQRSLEIGQYLINQGGMIMVALCQDGVLLAGVNPIGSQTIFQVFHRIALLGLGRAGDVEDMHRLALIQAYSTGLTLSKRDINVEDIVKEIARELEINFNYSRSSRRLHGASPGPYKADFLITELGFSPEEDFLEMINFWGGREFRDKAHIRGLGILERSVVRVSLGYKDSKDKDGNIEKDEKGEIKKVVDPQVSFQHPVTSGLLASMGEAVGAGLFIETVREIALFAGLMIYLLNERGGTPEMVYLDRDMLKKTKTDERRFHHIWQRITNPNLYKPSDPWQDWKKFVVPVYKKAKEGEISPKLKLLIEFYELIEKEDKKHREGIPGILDALARYRANYDFVMNLFKNNNESNKNDQDKKE